MKIGLRGPISKKSSPRFDLGTVYPIARSAPPAAENN
jgi:hypothetical protein